MYYQILVIFCGIVRFYYFFEEVLSLVYMKLRITIWFQKRTKWLYCLGNYNEYTNLE